MCITAIAAIGSALGGVASLAQATKKTPTVAQVDPAAEQAKADTLAAQNSNAALAAKNKSRVASSLLAGAAPTDGSAPASGYTPGKVTLGG